MLSNDTQKINITLTFPATRTSDLTVENFNIPTCISNTNYKNKSKQMTSPHSCQSVTFSPTQHYHTCRNLKCIISEGPQGGKITAGKTAGVETHLKCQKHEKTTKNEIFTLCAYKKPRRYE